MLTSRSNGGCRDVHAVEEDPPGGRQLEPGDHPEGRRLARARRAEHREELAVVDVEIDAGDGGDDVAAALASTAWRRAGRPRRRRTALHGLEPDAARPAGGDRSRFGRLSGGIAKRDLGLGSRGPGRATRASGSRSPHIAAPARGGVKDRARRSVASERLSGGSCGIGRAVDSAGRTRPIAARVAAPCRLAVALLAGRLRGGPAAGDATDRAGSSSEPREVNIVAEGLGRSCPIRSISCPARRSSSMSINGGLDIHEAGHRRRRRSRTRGRSPRRRRSSATAGPTPVGERRAGGRRDPDRRRVRPAGRPRLDRSGRRPRSRTRSCSGCHIPGHWAKGMRAPSAPSRGCPARSDASLGSGAVLRFGPAPRRSVGPRARGRGEEPQWPM